MLVKYLRAVGTPPRGGQWTKTSLGQLKTWGIIVKEAEGWCAPIPIDVNRSAGNISEVHATAQVTLHHILLFHCVALGRGAVARLFDSLCPTPL